MAEPIATHQDCPDCGHQGCLTEWDNGTTYCHSCQLVKGGSSVTTIPTGAYEEYRGITKATAKVYESKVYEDNGTKVRTYPYPNGKTKLRYHPKDFTKNKGFKADSLFGADKFVHGANNRLFLTEGEEDCMSVYQMMGGREHVMSFPTATPSPVFWDNSYPVFDAYQEIIMVQDNDDAGGRLAEKLAKLFPNRVFVVKMTKHKDANEALTTKGGTQHFLDAYVAKERIVPSGIFNSVAQFTDIINEKSTATVIPTPWDELNDTIVGLATGEMYLITGEEGRGKTEILHAMEFHLIKNHPHVNIGVCHMEESKKTLFKTYASYQLEDNVRSLKVTGREPDIIQSMTDLTGSNNQLFVFEFTADQDPTEILSSIRYLSEVHNVKYFFVEPFQQLMYARDTSVSPEAVLTRIAVKMEKMCTDLDICIIMAAHVNDDGKVRSCRMASKASSVWIDVQRDHINENEDIRNTSTLLVNKNRVEGPAGLAGQLKFDPDTFMITEKVVKGIN